MFPIGYILHNCESMIKKSNDTAVFCELNKNEMQCFDHILSSTTLIKPKNSNTQECMLTHNYQLFSILIEKSINYN